MRFRGRISAWKHRMVIIRVRWGFYVFLGCLRGQRFGRSSSSFSIRGSRIRRVSVLNLPSCGAHHIFYLIVEMEYRSEDWAHSKRLALWASIFFLMNWIFGAAFIATPAVLADKVWNYFIVVLDIFLTSCFKIYYYGASLI